MVLEEKCQLVKTNAKHDIESLEGTVKSLVARIRELETDSRSSATANGYLLSVSHQRNLELSVKAFLKHDLRQKTILHKQAREVSDERKPVSLGFIIWVLAEVLCCNPGWISNPNLKLVE